MLKALKIFLFTVLCLSSSSVLAISSCGINLPGKFQSVGSDPELEIEIFKQMPHFSHYLFTSSNQLLLIVGDKNLDSNKTKAVTKETIKAWSSQKLQETLDLYPSRSFNIMESSPFIERTAGTILTFRYKKEQEKDTTYQQRLFVIQSLTCAIDFMAISTTNNHKLVQQVVGNLKKSLETQHPGKFWIIPKSLWYSDLGQANKFAFIILALMLAISIGLILYVRKRE